MASWQDPDYKSTFGDQPLTAAELNNIQNGLRDEINELRAAVMPIPGVISGLAGSIDGTSVDFAAGVAYAGGYKTLGTNATAPTSPATSPAVVDLTIAFAGTDGAATYYLYLDGAETAETSALKKTVTLNTATGDDCLLLYSVAWDGATTLSALTDLRQWGVVPGEYVINVDAALATSIDIRIPVVRNICLRRPYCIVSTCGSADGPTYVDVQTGAAGSTATIWSAAASRMTIAHDATDGAVVLGGAPDQNYKVAATPAAAKVIDVDVDAIATGATGLHVVIPFAYY
jgi:hypothetical protein